jgi:hypothetical protein
MADSEELSTKVWHKKYKVVNSLVQIYKIEDIHWKHRGDATLLLEGDSNT